VREHQEQFENIRNFASQEELEAYLKITNLLQSSPIPSDELIANLGLYLDRSALGHIIFLEQLYRRIMGVGRAAQKVDQSPLGK
jgi:hypothetical protein